MSSESSFTSHTIQLYITWVIENRRVPGLNAVYSGRSLQTFRGNVLVPTSWARNKLCLLHYSCWLDLLFALKMYALRSSETSVNFNQTTWRHDSEENIRYYMVWAANTIVKRNKVNKISPQYTTLKLALLPYLWTQVTTRQLLARTWDFGFGNTAAPFQGGISIGIRN